MRMMGWIGLVINWPRNMEDEFSVVETRHSKELTWFESVLMIFDKKIYS